MDLAERSTKKPQGVRRIRSSRDGARTARTLGRDLHPSLYKGLSVGPGGSENLGFGSHTGSDAPAAPGGIEHQAAAHCVADHPDLGSSRWRNRG